MAESSVTIHTSQRWIILLNSRDQDDWRLAIDQAIMSNPALVESDFVLTEKVEDALNSGASHDDIAAIISMTGPGDSQLLANPDTRHSEISSRTGYVDDLMQLRADRIFGPTSFRSGSVEIFSGLTVTAPRAVAAAPYEAALAYALESFGPARHSAKWRRDLFSYPKPPMMDEPPHTFDLTGRPKFVVFGPYLTMPIGRWTARIELIFDAPATRHRFRVDWGGVTDFQSLEFRPERPGLYQIELTHDWTESAPCELRVLALEGIFEGKLTFDGAEIRQATAT